jgi:hypothetical protein
MVGGVLGAPVATLLQGRLRPRTMSLTMTLAGTLLIPSPLTALPVPIVVLLAPAANAGLFALTLRQASEELRGRVTSTVTMTAMTLATLAPLLAGLLVEHVSTSCAVGAFATAEATAAVLTLVIPGLQDADSRRPHQPERARLATTGARGPAGHAQSRQLSPLAPDRVEQMNLASICRRPCASLASSTIPNRP